MKTSSLQKILNFAAESLERLSLEEFKHQLVRGNLLSSIQKNLMEDEMGYLLTDLRLKKEIHRKKSALLILHLKLISSNTRSVICDEIVLQCPLGKSTHYDKAIFSWIYPYDPDLPLLAKIINSCSDFIQKTAWERMCESKQTFFCREDIFVEALQYNPRLRATFLLSSPTSDEKVVLKVINPRKNRKCLDKIKAIQSSSLNSRIIIPCLISYSVKESVFLYDCLPGLSIKKLEPAKLAKIKRHLFGEISRILVEIHQTEISLLPQWRPTKEMGKLQRFLSHLRVYRPAIYAIGQSLSEKFYRCFVQNAQPYAQMIHNSFSTEHIFYNKDGSNLLQAGTFGVIDLESAVVGPGEKDIGTFLSGLSDDREDYQNFIDQYQKNSGRKINHDLVNAFLQYSRLLKLCRRILCNNILDEVCIEAVKEIEKKLDKNPL